MELPEIDPAASFRWSDGDRVVHYGRGALNGAPALLVPGYVLLANGPGRCACASMGSRRRCWATAPTSRWSAPNWE